MKVIHALLLSLIATLPLTASANPPGQGNPDGGDTIDNANEGETDCEDEQDDVDDLKEDIADIEEYIGKQAEFKAEREKRGEEKVKKFADKLTEATTMFADNSEFRQALAEATETCNASSENADSAAKKNKRKACRFVKKGNKLLLKLPDVIENLGKLKTKTEEVWEKKVEKYTKRITDAETRLGTAREDLVAAEAALMTCKTPPAGNGAEGQ